MGNHQFAMAFQCVTDDCLVMPCKTFDRCHPLKKSCQCVEWKGEPVFVMLLCCHYDFYCCTIVPTDFGPVWKHSPRSMPPQCPPATPQTLLHTPSCVRLARKRIILHLWDNAWKNKNCKIGLVLPSPCFWSGAFRCAPQSLSHLEMFRFQQAKWNCKSLVTAVLRGPFGSFGPLLPAHIPRLGDGLLTTIQYQCCFNKKRWKPPKSIIWWASMTM